MAFHYNVIPSATGSGFSTRVVNQEDYTEAQLVADVAADTGLTPAQVTAAGTALLRRLILAGQNTRRTRNLFQLLTFLPRSGGTFASPDFQPSAQALNIGINGSLTPDGQALLEDGMTFVREGVLGQKTPLVERVYDASSRQRDTYTPGGGFKLGGHDFGHPDLTQPAVGVFLQPVAGGAPVRVPSYISWTDTEITGVWPAGSDGQQHLLVVTKYEAASSVRNTTYTNRLAD